MSHIATNEFLNPLQVKEKEKSQSPKGLKVLAIDDNVVCLKVLESILQKCGYTVTTTRDANVALEMLRKKNKERFDIVITDVVRDDMDGFKLLEAIGLEMDIPVIMTSANDETKTIVEGIKHGAIDYLVKPIKMEDVNNIFQHVTPSTTTTSNSYNNNKTREDDDHSTPISSFNYDTNELGVQESSSSLLPIKRKGQQEEEGEDEETKSCCQSRKKNRMRWSKELHYKFLDAYYQLQADNLDKAVPKRILEIMNEPGITREKVASHLQKFRNGLKKQNATSFNSPGHSVTKPQQNAMNFAPISSSYPWINNVVYRPVLAAANAISQPGLQYHHQKMDDEIANNVHHHSAIFGYQNPVLGDSVYICPYSSGPVSMNNYVGAPFHPQVLGDVSVSPFDSTGLVVSTSTQGQLEGGDLISFNGRGIPEFGVGANENNCGSLDDDDFNIMLQQFQDNSAPRL